jgi:predicted SAM-dependent methyltransferase
VVDNGSDDDTVAWLRTLPPVEGHRRNLKIVENRENRGFAPAVNQGLARAEGAFVVLLNNDLLVPPGWLSALMRQLNTLPHAGAVGPMGSGIGGKQDYAAIYGPLPYITPEGSGRHGFLDFAARWESVARGTFTEAKSLSGSCLFMRTELLRALGGLDEGCRMGADDADLSLRLRLQGYRLYVAEDVFVHHYDHVTFAALDSEAQQRAADTAWEHFAQKWRDVGVDWDTLFMNETRWHYDARFRNRRGFAPAYRPARVLLDLGSGDNPAGGVGNPDWIHCDCRPFPCVEVVADVRALPFPERHADEVRASHVIEHFDLDEVPAVLREWARVLKPGGRLTVITPDLAFMCREYAAGRMSAGAVSMNLLGTGGWPENVHRSLWDRVSLTMALEAQGFDRIVRDPDYPAWQLKLDAVKR